MAFISHKYKFVYIHIEKCGGTSVKEALCRLHGSSVKCDVEELRHSSINRTVPRDYQPDTVHGHARPQDVIEAVPETATYRFFTVVRNPAARILSYYRHKLRFADLDIPRHPDGRFFNFNEVMQLTPGVLLLEPLVYYTPTHKPMHIQKLETLPADWFSLLHLLGVKVSVEDHDKLGLHQLNYDADHADYRQEFNEHSKALVSAYYAKDFEIYGYDF